jgi:hypothetical protein
VLAAPEKMALLIRPILTATGGSRPEWFPVAPKSPNTSSPPRRGLSESGVDTEEADGVADATSGSISGQSAETEFREPASGRPESHGFTPPPAPHTRGEGKRHFLAVRGRGIAQVRPRSIAVSISYRPLMRPSQKWDARTVHLRTTFSLRCRNIIRCCRGSRLRACLTAYPP